MFKLKKVVVYDLFGVDDGEGLVGKLAGREQGASILFPQRI